MSQPHPVQHATPEEIPSGSVLASLTYTLKKPEKLIYLIAEMGEDEDSPEYRKWYVSHDMTIRDIRPAQSGLSLDREGFVLRRAKTCVKNFYDDAEVKAVYNPEVERLVLETTGADKVLIFDHTIRVASDEVRRQRQAREIVDLVHVDYTEDSGPQRVSDLLGEEEAESHLGSRFAIINLWRSIAGTVQSSPLALCDARSVVAEDWVPCGLDYGDRMGEIYNVAYNPNHQWCYAPGMTADEVLIFKNYDSARDGRARFTPHTAFADPTTPEGAPFRESIETRVLAFFTDKQSIT